ncbi:hypothetical protein FBUS_03904 [Fasciolopsis buskii]|uniref:Uncharacterized protein n=1 Tax=Fasciolopsis buskii TaxID=27845 RepID=A0A8E0VDG6_9TREM|nr:hypothetical protein FBUS_03904 [Fasciolopsis buski]
MDIPRLKFQPAANRLMEPFFLCSHELLTSLRNNNSPVRLSKTNKRVSSHSLTRLRSRCHSMEHELEQMDGEQHKPVTATTDDPNLDSRIEASSSNQTLRKRLEELQRLQTERELALRKARHMVDTLICKVD